MFDSKGRNIHYLRLSVTDLCNLRCRYCMPDGVDKLEREDILTYEEFLRLAALFARCGVDTVRVTGGEPLVRKGVEQLVKGLKAIPGIRKVTMTTNAVLLEQQCRRPPWDAVRPSRFSIITSGYSRLSQRGGVAVGVPITTPMSSARARSTTL